jgi:serine/threonine protein kinase
VLGYGHAFSIDIWSIGCVIAELFFGLPLFCGQNEIQLLRKQQRWLGEFPTAFVERAPRCDVFFLPDGTLKSEDVCQQEFFEWCTEGTLASAIRKFRLGQGQSEGEKEKVRARREQLLDLLLRALAYDPGERITAGEALEHPFFLPDVNA